MKNLIAVFAKKAIYWIGAIIFSIVVAFSCTKQAEQRSAPHKMNGVEFTKKYGFELPFLDYTNSSAVARGKKAKAESVTLTVAEDLVISGNVSCTTSPDAEWGGIQKFLALPLSNDGAVSYCNFYWDVSQDPPGPMVCPTTTPGVYRGWTSDHNYDVHLSSTLQL